jgi:transcriptional regulator with XRE-family HTH domain
MDHKVDHLEETAKAGTWPSPAGSAYAYVGDRLRELRKRRGLTQADVARLISVSPQQYQKYEDAQTKCSLTTLITLSEHFDVPLADLLPPSQPVAAHAPAAAPLQRPDIPVEADLLARLVGAFVKLRDTEQKTRLVQLVEAIQSSHERAG